MKNKILCFLGGVVVATTALLLVGPTGSARNTSTVKVVEQVEPSVVNISTEQIVSRKHNPFAPYSSDPFFDEFFRDFFDPRYRRHQIRQSLGSGVIIDRDGHVLTNEHVVISAGKILVTLMNGRTYVAELIGANSETDLAVLKLKKASKLPYLDMGDSDGAMVGEPAIAIGNPFGLGHTVTVGVISATKRSIQTSKRVYHDFIQTDASINPGNSGGPLLTADGELIGINSAIYQKAQGIGFALPINRARNVVEDLIRYGEVQIGWLGVQVMELTSVAARRLDYRGPGGVLVSLIVDGGPAQKASLKYGDIIEEMDGISIRTKNDFRSAARLLPVGKKVKLTVNRNGSNVKLSIVTREFPPEMAEDLARYMLGLQVGPSPANIRGVMIENVSPGSASAGIGLRRGDIIIRLNKDTVKNVQEWNKAVSKIRIMDSVLLLVQRGRSVYYVTLPLSP